MKDVLRFFLLNDARSLGWPYAHIVGPFQFMRIVGRFERFKYRESTCLAPYNSEILQIPTLAIRAIKNDFIYSRDLVTYILLIDEHISLITPERSRAGYRYLDKMFLSTVGKIILVVLGDDHD